MDTKSTVNLQSLVDTHEQPFVVIDRDFRIVAVNRAYERHYGIARESMVGQCCYQISHHNEHPCFEAGEECPYQMVFGDGRRSTCLHMHYDDQGQIHRVRINAYPITDSDGEVYLGEAIEDISAPREEGAGKHFRMVGNSPAFKRMLQQLKLAASADAPVLLQGETGTGKDIAANYIHRYSKRADKPFLTLDCTVLTEPLFEAEVFGHERGAFTGSVGSKEGLFEIVDGGTLFLDEIGELPASLQAKLLRVLETGEYRRVGGRQILHTNARLICATNRDLASEVATQGFREDLYYRVACLHIQVPRLCDRLQDIPLLAEALLERINASGARRLRLTEDAFFELQAYVYPGNIRELRNILSVAAANTAQAAIDGKLVASVIECMESRRRSQPAVALEESVTIDTPCRVTNDVEGSASSLQNVEAQHIADLLAQCNGNRREAAARLGISERTIYRKLKRYGLT